MIVLSNKIIDYFLKQSPILRELTLYTLERNEVNLRKHCRIKMLKIMNHSKQVRVLGVAKEEKIEVMSEKGTFEICGEL